MIIYIIAFVILFLSVGAFFRFDGCFSYGEYKIKS